MIGPPGNINAGKRMRSSFTQGGTYAARIFSGRVVSFNLDSYTVSVHLDNPSSDVDDIQVGMPYFHYANGEGFYSIPEVGAKCVVAYPSDGGDPFIVAFLGVMEETSGDNLDESQQEGGKSADGETAQELEDRGADADETFESTSDPLTYRNGRPLARPGDMMWRTRDGNSIELRRGGLVSIGSTGVCKRLYIPISNLIQDFAQNYNLSTPGTNVSHELVEQNEDDTRATYIFTIREYAEDSNASVSLRVGEIDDNFLQLSIKRDGVDYRKGTVINESDLSLSISKSGDWTLYCGTSEVHASERNVYVDGKVTEEYGSLEQTVDGDRDIDFKNETKTGKNSKEELDRKEINAKKVELGTGLRGKLVRADLFVPFYNGHTHAIPGGTTGTPVPPLTEAMVATAIVKGS